MKKNTLLQTKNLILGFTLIILLTCVSYLNASSPKQSTNLLKMSNAAYEQKKYYVAANFFESYLQNNKDSNYYPTINKLIDCYLQMRLYSLAMQTYERIENTSYLTLADQNFKVRLADLLARFNKYDEASVLLKTVPGYDEKLKGYQPRNIYLMKKDSIKWNVLGLNFNTGYREFSPFLLNNKLIFCSNHPENSTKKANEWDGLNYSKLWKTDVFSIDTTDLTYTENAQDKKNVKIKGIYRNYELAEYGVKNGKNLSIPKPNKITPADFPSAELIKGLNKINYNVGTSTIDKNRNIYFTANSSKKDKDGFYKLCIMQGTISDNKIDNIRKFNTFDKDGLDFSVIHPTINNEGTLLIFCSDKKGGIGGYDLYYMQRKDNSKPWNEARILKSRINTIGNEVYPTITKDGYLYFSSDAMKGLGGLDIYRVLIKDILSNNILIEHIDYPINSSYDDFGWTQDDYAEKCFFTSDRDNDNDNIFLAINSANKLAANTQLFPKLDKKIIGKVIDKSNNNPVKDAYVFYWEQNSDDVYLAKTNPNGEYLLPVDNGGDVIIKSTKAELGDDCIKLHIDRNSYDSIIQVKNSLALGNIYKVGYTWKLDNIQYDFDKWNIRADAMPLLDELVKILKNYPIKVELSSHTDSRGNDNYNMKLSEQRAKSVVEYLVRNGIERSRVIAKGYGEQFLLNGCSNDIPCSESDHQINRRTEVKVLNYDTKKIIKNINLTSLIPGKKIKLNSLPKDFFDKCLDKNDANVNEINEIINEQTSDTQNTYISAEASKYYVIISSSTNRSASELQLNKLISEGYKNALLLNYGVRYRVAIKCNSMNEAEQYKEKLQNIYKDAWILTE